MASSTRKGKPKGAYTEKRLAGLVPWKPGAPSPNPGGRPRQHREMVAELRANATLIKDAILGLVMKGLEGKLTNSEKILSQHLWECWQAMYGGMRKASCSLAASTLATTRTNPASAV